MNQGNRNKGKVYFAHFDVLRFLAAFMIVIVHAYEGWYAWYGTEGLSQEKLSGFWKLVDQFIMNFGIGVDIFFLLSGFIITYLLLEEKKRIGKIAIGKFMVRRSLRIWPLYFGLIIITPVLISWLGYESPHYLANALFVGNFDTIETQGWTYPFAHFWSICIEEHFYLVWPFIIYLIPKKRLLPTFGALILASISFRMFTFYSMDNPWYSLYLHTFSRMDVLVIGAVGAYFYSIKPFTFSLKKGVRFTLFSGLILLLSVSSYVEWNSIFSAGFKKYLYMGIIIILLLDFNFNPNFTHFLRKKSIVHYFGKISYGIYMFSNFLLSIFIEKVMWRFGTTNMVLYFTLIIILSIVVPILSYEIFEKYILRLSKKFRVIETDR